MRDCGACLTLNTKSGASGRSFLPLTFRPSCPQIGDTPLHTAFKTKSSEIVNALLSEIHTMKEDVKYEILKAKNKVRGMTVVVLDE